MYTLDDCLVSCRVNLTFKSHLSKVFMIDTKASLSLGRSGDPIYNCIIQAQAKLNKVYVGNNFDPEPTI